MTTDEEWVELLRRALRPPEVEPPPESVAAMARAVSHRFEPANRTRRLKSRLLAASGLFALVASGSGAAVAMGAVGLPPTLRSVAHDVGLPVDSVQLAQAKAEAARLRLALRMGDGARIARDASALEARYDHLNRQERQGIGSQVDSLLDGAARYGVTVPAPRPARPVEPAEPAESVEPPSHDDDTSPTTVAPPEGPTQPTGGDSTAQSPDRSDTGGGSGDTSPTTAAVSQPTSPLATTTTTVPNGGRDGGSDGGSPGGGGGSDGGGSGSSDGGDG